MLGSRGGNDTPETRALRPWPARLAWRVLHADGNLLTACLFAACLCTALLCTACGAPPAASDTGAGDTATDDTADAAIAPGTDDASAATDAGPDAAPDGGEDADSGPAQCGTLPEPDNCPCVQNADCSSGVCAETPNGARCAGPCSGTCPPGFACVDLPTATGGMAQVCASVFAHLCDPCKSNAACQEVAGASARCIKAKAGGTFCGVGCKDVADCPPGYGCESASDLGGQASQQCVFQGPETCQCSATARAAKLGTPCTLANGAAICQGERVCLADGEPGAPKGGGLSGCLVPAGTETCDGADNDCDGQTDEDTCDDSNPCTSDTCTASSTSTQCQHTLNTLPCDADGSACTAGDHCQDGTCQPGPPLACDDGNPCTDDSCDPLGGCQHQPLGSGACDADGSACTEGDSCIGGACKPGAWKACESGEACKQASCDAVSGTCVSQNQDGSACNDGNPCTTNDVCGGGSCAGSDTGCDDGNSCTSDVCDPKVGCLHGVVGGPCDDGDTCTHSDLCANGACVGTPQDVTLCQDDNPCTYDTCDKKAGCIHPPADGAFCFDGDDCSQGDHCQGGSCVGSSNVCACVTNLDCQKYDDGNQCNGVLFCDVKAPAGCKLNPGTIVQCDTTSDGPCVQSVCNPSNGQCTVQDKPNGTICDADGSICTLGDACKNGLCAAGLAPDCNDKNPCTTDACDAKSGCTHVFNTLPCDADGSACTAGDHCQQGVCQQGIKKVCEDGNSCTYDGCDVVSGQCDFEGAKISCSDGNLCTVGDSCAQNPGAGTWSCQAGAALGCDDGNPCTLDTCDAAKGCQFTPQANQAMPCYDGPAGTAGVGVCHGGSGQCDGNGVLGACVGQQVPGGTELCDGLDNDCDGATDSGCAAAGFSVRFATLAVDGVSGGDTGVHALAGAAWLGAAFKPAANGTGACTGALPFLLGKHFCW